MVVTLTGYDGNARADKVIASIFKRILMANISAKLAGGINVVAFLDVVASCYLGIAAAHTPNFGYDAMRVNDAEPLIGVDFEAFMADGNASLRLGRYGISVDEYARLTPVLAITNLSPLSQDRLAMARLSEAGAMPLIRAGQLHVALDAARRAWPGLLISPLARGKDLWPELVSVYRAAGGTFAIG